MSGLDKRKNIFLNISIFLGAGIFIFLIYTLIILTGDELKTLDHMSRFQDEIKQKNLTFPFPNMQDNQFLTIAQQRENLYSLSIEEFAEELKKNYIYTYEDYNCRYWTYVWGDYWAYNQLSTNDKFKIITTDTHVYAMIYDTDFYCVVDQTNVMCVDLDN